GSAAMVADQLRLDAVLLEELDCLRVIAGRDLHLVTALAHERDQRPEHQHVGRCRDVHPNLHAATAAGLAATCSCQSVNVRSPQSWRERSSRPATWSSSKRCTVSGRKKPWRRSVSSESVSRAKGTRGPRSQAAAGMEKPRFLPETTESGRSGATAFRSRRFFEKPRTLRRVGRASASVATTGSRKGTRASSEWAMLARSVFTSRTSTR